MALTRIDWVNQVKNKAVYDSREYDFDAQTPGGSLSAGLNTITLSPVPLGVNATDSNHYLYISGGTGTAEAVLISGGTAVAGSNTGTIFVTCTNTHSGAWTIQSATAGIQEAINDLPVEGGTVQIPPAVRTIYQTVSIGDGSSSAASTRQGIVLEGMTNGPRANTPIAAGSVLSWGGPTGGTMLYVRGPIGGVRIEELGLTSANGTAGIGLKVQSAEGSTFHRLKIYNMAQWGIYLDSYNPTTPGQTNAVNNNHWRDIYMWTDGTGGGGTNPAASGLYVGYCNHNYFYNTYSWCSPSGYGVTLGPCDACSFFGCDVWKLRILPVDGALGLPNSVTLFGGVVGSITVSTSAGGGTWVPPTTFGGVLIWPLHTGDGETIPNDSRIHGITTYGQTFGIQTPRITAITTAPQVIPNAAWATMAWNAADVVDVHDNHDHINTPSRITVLAGQAGTWTFDAQVLFAANATGVRLVRLWKNGTTEIARASSMVSDSTYDTALQVTSGNIEMVPTDYMEVEVLQTSGGTLNVKNGAGISFFSARKTY